jgi:hypothetical protein
MRFRLPISITLSLLLFLSVLGWVRSYGATDSIHIARESRGKELWQTRTLSVSGTAGSIRITYSWFESSQAASAYRNSFPEKTSFRVLTGGRVKALERTSIARMLGLGFESLSSASDVRFHLWLPYWLLVLLLAFALWRLLGQRDDRCPNSGSRPEKQDSTKAPVDVSEV